MIKRLNINKEKANQFLVNFAILFLTWNGMFRRSFNSDTLIHMKDLDMDMSVKMLSGRYLSALFDYLLYRFTGLTTATHTGVTVFIEIIMLTFSVGIVQGCFTDKIKFRNVYDRLTFSALTALLFANVLFAEPLMFCECGIMYGFAYLFASIGVYFFTKKKYFLTFIFCLLSTMEYQVAVIYAAMIISTWIFLHNNCKITVQTVIQEVICGFATLGSGVLNVISVSIGVRLGLLEYVFKGLGVGGFGDKIKECMKDFVMILFDSKELLPSAWIPLIVTVIAWAIPIYKFKKEKNGKALVYYILLAIAMVIMIYILPLVQEGMMITPRMVNTFYVMQAMLLLIAFIQISDKWKTAMCYMCCLYLVVHIMFGNIIVTNHMVSNTLDKLYASMAYEKIKEYEEQTGITVRKLAVVNDTNCPLSYDNVYYKTHQTNERTLGVVTNTLMNVVSGRDFEKIDMDEQIYETYFKDKNWDYFDAEQQLVIVGDTAYWAIF